MPINKLKAYNFKPNFTTGEVPSCLMQIRSSLFSRLHAGGMFFRSLERGQIQNHISIKLEDVDVLVRPAGSNADPVPKSEMEQLSSSLYEVVSGKTRLSVTSPLVTMSSFKGEGNGKIGGIVAIADPPLNEYLFTYNGTAFVCPELGTATVGTPFKSAYLAFMISKGVTPFVNGDVFIIKFTGGTETHEIDAVLNTYNVTSSSTTTPPDTVDPVTGETIPGIPSTETTTTLSNFPGLNSDGTPTEPNPNPNIPLFRALVNANSKMISMPVRGVDRTDMGQEDIGYTLFSSVLMSGGDGLPVNAIGIKTGPDRAFCFINYSETPEGQFTVIARVYEWAGDNQTDGIWQIYS